MTDPRLQLCSADCLFLTILGFLLPFYQPAACGNDDEACDAITELVDAYGAATRSELDLIGRMLGYGAAATDSLRLSMQPGLSDTKILQYRGNAVALGRSAEQCRKVLEAMQAKREQNHEPAATAPPMPPRPTPPHPSAPPSGRPPAQPHPSAHAVSTQPSTSAHPQTSGPLMPDEPEPAAHAASPYPNSKVEGDPRFTTDIEVMKRNVQAMLTDLQARAKEFGPDAPEATIEQMVLERSQPILPGSAASTHPSRC